MRDPLKNYRTLLDLITLGPESIAAPAEQMKGFRELFQQLSAWANHTGIQAFGLAHRLVGGLRTNELALKVYVTKKLPEQKVGSVLIPTSVRLPDRDAPLYLDVEGQERAITHVGPAGTG